MLSDVTLLRTVPFPQLGGRRVQASTINPSEKWEGQGKGNMSTNPIAEIMGVGYWRVHICIIYFFFLQMLYCIHDMINYDV